MKQAASSLLAISIAVMLASPLLAEEPEYGAIEVQTDLVSNYIWRGQDVMAIYARQNGEQYGANSGAWTFQPSITWSA